METLRENCCNYRKRTLGLIVAALILLAAANTAALQRYHAWAKAPKPPTPDEATNSEAAAPSGG